MTRERIDQLERDIADAIEECQLYGEAAHDPSLAFWRGAKMVVEELKMELAKTGPGEPFQARAMAVSPKGGKA